MAGQTVVTTAVFRAETQGVDQAAAALAKLQGSAGEASRAVDTFAREQQRAAAAMAQAQKAMTPPGGLGQGFVKQTEQTARGLATVQREAERLQKSLDPAYRSMAKLAEIQAKLNRAVEGGAISWQRHGELMAAANDRFGQTAKAAETANDNIRLTTNQMQGLGYQINDIGTMLAMGASPFQVMASQAGQVVQVLGEGPGGVRGALTAIKDAAVGFATTAAAAMGPFGLAVAGAAAAAGGLLYLLSDSREVRSAEERMTAFEGILDQIEQRFHGAGDAARGFFERLNSASGTEVLADAKRSLVEFQADYKKAMEDLSRGEGLTRQIDPNRQLAPALEEIRALFGQVRAGTMDVQTFRERLAEIEMRPGTIKEVRDFANEIRKAASEAATLEAQMRALELATSRAAAPEGTGGRVGGIQTRIDDAFATGGYGPLPEQLTKQAEEYKKTRTEADRYAESLERMRGSLSGSVDALRLQVDMFGQSSAAIAEARFAADAMADASRAAIEAGKDGVDESTATFIREQAAEYGALTQRLEDLNAAERDRKKAAEESQAEVKRLADFEAELAFERDQVARSAGDQRIASRLRAVGVDIESEAGRSYADFMRQTQQLSDARSESEKRAQKELLSTRDIIEDVAGSLVDGFMRGEGVVDGLIDTFARLGQQVAQAGLEKLLDGVFGTGKSGQASGGGIVGAVGQVASAATGGRTSTISGGGSSGYSMPSSSPVTAKISAGDFAQASGQMLEYSSRFKKGVDSRLMNILEVAASRFDMRVEAFSGVRSGSKGFHPKGLAADVALYDDTGRRLANYQNAADFRQYERFAQVVKTVQREIAPELDKLLTFGGYFKGPKGHYGALDSMHFDLGGAYRMQGGSWENGLNAQQRRYFPGVQSVGMGAGGEPMALARAVEVGSINATRKLATGGVAGVSGGSAWGAQFDNVQNVSPMIAGGGAAGGGMLAGFQNFMKSPLFQGGLTALSAGAAGYQSGDPLGGAFSGALSGLAMGNPIMAGVGAVAGLIGGIFGKSKQKKEAKRQAQMQADQAWTQAWPQFLEFEDQVNRVPQGTISGQIREMEKTFIQFESLAKATGRGENTSRVEELRADMQAYGDLLKEGFRDTLEPVLADLAAGRGLDTAFTKARDGVQAEAEAYRGLIEDVKTSFAYDSSGVERARSAYQDQIAKLNAEREKAAAALQGDTASVFGLPGSNLVAQIPENKEAIAKAAADRDAAIAEYEATIGDSMRRYDEALAAATKSAREGLLRIVSGDIVEQSDIEKAMAEAQGAAAGLRTALRDLGMSAAEADEAIAGALTKRMELLRKTFVEGLEDRIADLDGKGYIADFRALMEEQANLLKDASLINVDTSLVDTFFTKQAQAIVDGAEISGDAFAELIRLFPQLTDKVKAFSNEAEEAAEKLAAAAGRMNDYLGRYFSATTDTSTLSGAMASLNRRAMLERQSEMEAGGGAMAQLNAALAAEKVVMIQDLLRQAYQDQVSEIEETISRLDGLSKEWGDLRRSLKLDDTLSPLSQLEQLNEARNRFRDVSARAAAGDEEAQAELASISQQYLEEAKAYYASSEDYFAAFNEVQGVLETSESLASQQLAAAKSQLDIAKAQLDAMTGVKDGISLLTEALTAALADLRTAETAAGIGGGTGTTGGAPGGSYNQSTASQNYLANNPDVLAAIAGGYTAGLPAGSSIGAIAAAHYGLHGQSEGRGWATGGLVTGPGTGTSDSIMARLSHGEFVMPARAVTPQTLPMLEGMRAGLMAGNDNSALVAELRELRTQNDRLMRMLIATTGGGLERVAQATERGSDASEDAAATGRRRAAGSNR